MQYMVVFQVVSAGKIVALFGMIGRARELASNPMHET
jgi:hypothetical protein